MYISDRLFSESTGEGFYRVTLTEEEYALFSELQKEFTKSNLNAKDLRKWQNAHPEVKLNLNDTKEANRLVKEYERQHGATTTKEAFQHARDTKAAVNESERIADTTARHLAEGNRKQALSVANHSSNPEQAMRVQEEIRGQVMKDINKETKETARAKAYQEGLEKRVEKTSAQNVGVGTRRRKPDTALTPEQLEKRKLYEQKRQQRQVERRMRKNKLSVKKTAQQTGKARQQVANQMMYKDGSLSREESIKNLMTPKSQEVIKNTTGESFNPHEFKNLKEPKVPISTGGGGGFSGGFGGGAGHGAAAEAESGMKRLLKNKKLLAGAGIGAAAIGGGAYLYNRNRKRRVPVNQI